MEHTIILAPKAQGRGVARALMQDIEIIAKSNGVRSLMAGISAENVGALGFHQHMGFKIVGTAPQAGRKFDRWIDFILMQKIIGAD